MAFPGSRLLIVKLQETTPGLVGLGHRLQTGLKAEHVQRTDSQLQVVYHRNTANIVVCLYFWKKLTQVLTNIVLYCTFVVKNIQLMLQSGFPCKVGWYMPNLIDWGIIPSQSH